MLYTYVCTIKLLTPYNSKAKGTGAQRELNACFSFRLLASEGEAKVAVQGTCSGSVLQQQLSLSHICIHYNYLKS